MQIWHAIVLGIVEGITEFLPVSSTGHLILTTNILNIPHSDFLTTFEIFIQLGAISAVVYLYGTSLLSSFKKIQSIGIAFIPAALVGGILYQYIKHFLLGNIIITIVSLIAGGIFFWLMEHYLKKRQLNTSQQSLTTAQLLIIGIGQSISIIPGVSRSAATMFTGMLMGLSRKEAVEFSFLLAIPTIAAATGYDVLKSSFQFSSQERILLSIGFLSACISAFITIRWFLHFISTNSFVPFAIYRILLGILFICILLMS